MKRARIEFSPLERAYNEEYGMFPDYHFTTLRRKGNSIQRTSELVQTNMDKIYQREKAKHLPDGFILVTNEQVPF